MKFISLATFALLPLLAAALPTPVVEHDARAVNAASPMKRGGEGWAPAPQIKKRGSLTARAPKPSPSSIYRRSA
ncbi:hypothetical protein EXIGLDRAFT_828665 [Exidia glandulosa HHB12029]|uniref:Uncharacterized protein n=1 Tax=Exidia glandulosa HHB12029 TaxID=1314781 RepID=A0A165QA34_EXIGL|nr:hypothetical protein EXIGLDRAFT_828665 [Exidia glandulosa HHB12029]